MNTIQIETQEQIDNIRKDFEDKYNNHINYVITLSEPIKKFINLYTGDHYREFNKKMREESQLNALYQNMLKNIDLAFKNSPIISQSLYVYKGIDKYMTEFSDKSYVSTSLTYLSAKSFSGTYCCILKILLPPGTKILPVMSISRAKEEDEILLDRNGIISITNHYINTVDNMKILDCVYIHKDSVIIRD